MLEFRRRRPAADAVTAWGRAMDLQLSRSCGTCRHAVGGLTSVAANLLSHRIQIKGQRLQYERNRRQMLYRDFIEEASKVLYRRTAAR